MVNLAEILRKSLASQRGKAGQGKAAALRAEIRVSSPRRRFNEPGPLPDRYNRMAL